MDRILLHRALGMVDIPNNHKCHNSLDINNQALRWIKSRLHLQDRQFLDMEIQLRLELEVTSHLALDTPLRVE